MQVASNFYAEYARHREHEGRALRGTALKSLPYLRSGPLARQWQVRARSFDAFVSYVVKPFEGSSPLDILDLGAGNGWLSYRMAQRGHRAVALDIRNDSVDGLGASAELVAEARFDCVGAPFEALPFGRGRFDITVFNAALHYACDLAEVLGEAIRVTRRGGVLAVMDSPFYRRRSDGEAMIAEKRIRGRTHFGDAADVLLAPTFIEYLTRQSLVAAVPGLFWKRHRVLYPLWYELRPLLARLKCTRAPSRFDLWTADIP